MKFSDIYYQNCDKKIKENREDFMCHSCSSTYEIDESELFDFIDEVLAKTDLSTLEKARQNIIKNGENTEIIDNAIATRKQIEENRDARLSSILSGLLDSTKQYNRSDIFNLLNEYESYNFEEENIEDDDFYFDDLD